jgi:hypothetical protein
MAFWFWGEAMKQFVTILLMGLAVAVTQPALAADVSKDIAARVEAIPIQTLTISDGPQPSPAY